MIQTNTEYMSDPARVERVVQKFMDVTLKEFRSAKSERAINYITSEIIPYEHLSAEKVQDMPYIEFACLIHSMGDNPEYGDYYYDSLSEQLVYYKCVATILGYGGKSLIPVRLFLELPLKAFYDYMDRISPQKGLQDEFRYIKGCCKYKDDYTIKDFLTEKTEALRKPWVPIATPEVYQEEIEDAHRDIGRLLIDSFQMAFPHRFLAEDVCDRYREPPVAKRERNDYFVTANKEPMEKTAK